MKLSMSLKAIVFTGICLAVSTSTAFASNSTKTSTFTVAKEQTLTGNQYVSAETATIDGTIQGDLIVAAQKIVINGTVTGSLIAIASEILVPGTVDGSIRTAAEQVSVTGKVGGDITSIGNKLSTSKESKIGQSVFFAGNEAVIDGAVGGSVSKKLVSERTGPTMAEIIYGMLTNFLGLALLGVLLYSMQSSIQTEELFSRLKANFLKSLGLGLLIIFFVPILSIVLLLTTIGHWLGLTFFAGFIVMLCLAMIDSGYFLGKLALGQTTLPNKQVTTLFLIGIFILSLIMIIPVINVFAFALIATAIGNRISLLKQMALFKTTALHD